MGRRKRGNRSGTTLAGEMEEDQNGPIRKVPRLDSRQPVTSMMRLSQEQEDRLGSWSSSMQWIMRIAQDRGCMACLALVSASITSENVEVCRFVMHSLDGQQLSIVIRGNWTEKAASVMARAGGKEMVLLSGLGARIPSSGSEVTFYNDKMIAEVINVDTLLSQGCFEVVEGGVISMPRAQEAAHTNDAESEAMHIAIGGTTERQEAPYKERESNSPLTERQGSSSPCQTPLRDHTTTRQATSVTPGWLRTPASAVGNNLNMAVGPSSSRSESEVKPSIPIRGARSSETQTKLLSTRIFTPINLLVCDEKIPYNTIGLIMTDNTARRALSGTRDWKITINLINVEESKSASNASVVPFNLFAREEGWLPRSKPGCILLLRGIKVRPFNQYPQGSGYANQYEWCLMDTSEKDENVAMSCSENSNISDAEKGELKRQYRWYRKHHKGSNQVVVPSRRNQRSLIKLQDVEKEVFFDTTVEIVKLWTGSPPEIYVTDYTTHPQFYAANDVYLDGFSREELYEQQQECNDAGNGRVLPISLWDDQQRAIEFVQTGMLVRLENVRPKMQPNEYLCGTMGGSGWTGGEKIKIVIVKDRQIIEEFQQRKDDYLHEVALRRVERSAANHQDDNRRQESEQEEEEQEEDIESEPLDSSSKTSEFRVPNLMPPPGQRPLAALENRSFELSETSASAKTLDSQESIQEEMPTLIEERLSSLPLISLRQLLQIPLDQIKETQTFICLAQVHDMKPGNLEEIVDVTCGICKKRLSAQHAFCATCAEEDGKDLHYRFNFALLIKPAERQDGSEELIRIPVIVRNEEAKHFLHGFHPRDVRNRDTTLRRLKQRLLPLLGSQLVGEDQEQKPKPFRLAICVSLSKRSDGMLYHKYHLTGTRLGKL